MAQTFYPITPVDITPGTTGSWQDVDVSSYVPSGTTGAIMHVWNDAWSDYAFGFRKNGSTDNRTDDCREYFHGWVAIGVDGNRVLELYVANNTNLHVYLIGYTMSGVTFFTNATEVTPESETWYDYDASGVASGAIGLIVEWADILWSETIGMRKNGSTDNRTGSCETHACGLMGCDENQVIEFYNLYGGIIPYIVGCVTDGATFNTNASDRSLGSTGSWQDLTALPSGAVMGFYEISSNDWLYYGLREDGSAENVVRSVYRVNWAMVECSGSQIVEGQISNTGIDFWEVGYAIEEAGVTEKESSDSGSGADSRVSGNPLVSLPKSETGSGVEGTPTQTAALNRLDGGGGADALTSLLGALAESDSGAGTDSTLSLLATLSKADSGNGTDSLFSRFLTLLESGSGADALSALLVAITGSDVAIGVEQSTLSLLLVSSDSGAGVDDRLSFLVSQYKADNSSGIEGIVGRDLVLHDYGDGADSLLALLAAIPGSETGGGLEQSSLSTIVTKFSSETASGVEVAALIRALISADGGTGSDLSILLKTILGSDGGGGCDALRALVETAGSDVRLYNRQSQVSKPSNQMRMPSKGVNL